MTDTQTRYSKPSELLADMEGHGIYKAEMLDRCDFDVSEVPRHSIEGTRETMDARGLGGTLDESDPEQKVIWGYVVAGYLAQQFLGHDPAAHIGGRGTSFRACADALRKAGH